MDRVSLLLICYLSVASVKTLSTEHCEAALGMQSGAIPDEHISASSSFDTAVSAVHGRIGVESGGGAWCPRQVIQSKGDEYLEVYVGDTHVITKVQVQGRFGNGQGREYTEKYKLQYWRPHMNTWLNYTDAKGNQLLEGNTNTYLAQTTTLQPAFIASRVRFLPYSNHPRTVCMRVEIYGCTYTEGLVSYTMRDGDVRGSDTSLRDVSYDGRVADGWLTAGLGQLTDGEIGHTGYEWVGWYGGVDKKPIEITFQFDTIRNFSAIHICTSNFFTNNTQVFSRAVVEFSVGGKYFHAHPPIEVRPKPDRIFEHARNISISLGANPTPAKYIKITLYFTLQWMLVSEVTFDSEPCMCNMSEELPREHISSQGHVPPISSHSQDSSDFIVGCLVAIGIVVGVVPIALLVLHCRTKLSSKSSFPKTSVSGGNSRKVSVKMRDFNLMKLPQISNAYNRAKGNFYGHVEMDDVLSSTYQTYKCPAHNPIYNSLAIPNTSHISSNITRKSIISDDSSIYAVPNFIGTLPRQLPDIYPLSQNILSTWPLEKDFTQHNPPPTPRIPPPTPHIPPPISRNPQRSATLLPSPQKHFSLTPDALQNNSLTPKSLPQNSITVNSLPQNSSITKNTHPQNSSFTTNTLPQNSQTTNTLPQNSQTTNTLPQNSRTTNTLPHNSLAANSLPQNSLTTNSLPQNTSLTTSSLHNALPKPHIPPPPDQNFITISEVYESLDIQATTGGVAFSISENFEMPSLQPLLKVEKQSICVLETLGAGAYGKVQICEVQNFTKYGAQKFVLKTLDCNVDDGVKNKFQEELHILGSLTDSNIARLVGGSTEHPPFILQEYMEHGDLYQFLRRHSTSESHINGRESSYKNVLSYGALLHLATQVASGMKHLENLCIVHRDLAARNCLVGRGLNVKISDFAMSQPRYEQDYCRMGKGNSLLPIRWMSLEAIIEGRFSSKSDIWAFGVTLWEILTLARKQPYCELSDDGVLENLTQGVHMSHLKQPSLCSREMYDLITACWRPNDRQRPPFWQILMFLQRKHLGYTLDYPD